MIAETEKVLFSLLPEKRAPWTQFLFSVSTQGLVLSALAWVSVIRPTLMPNQEWEHHFVQLINQPIPNSLPAPMDVLPNRTLKEPSPNTPRLPLGIRRKAHRDDLLETPQVVLTEPKTVPLLPIAVAIPLQVVKTDVFPSETVATTTISITPQTVQVGGFGDAKGAVAEENKAKPIRISRLDSFDRHAELHRDTSITSAVELPPILATVDFENQVVRPDSGNTMNTQRKILHPRGFDQIDPELIIVRPKLTGSSTPKIVSAEITLKPVPTYTDEARRLRIEGEVLLDVVFESRGKVRVIGVVSGLGHGLDEAAIRAAERIRFVPAQRDNQAVDFSAVLHILFRLA